VREMKCTSQHCCDKTIDSKMASYRESCFPNCSNLWLRKLLSSVLGGAIGPTASSTLDPPLHRNVQLSHIKLEKFSKDAVAHDFST